LKLLLLSLGDVKLRPLPRHQQLVHGLRHQRRYNLLDSRLDVGRGGDGDPGRSELRLDLRLETVLFCVRGSIVGFFLPVVEFRGQWNERPMRGGSGEW
jgi:hypothetical protein